MAPISTMGKSDFLSFVHLHMQHCSRVTRLLCHRGGSRQGSIKEKGASVPGSTPKMPRNVWLRSTGKSEDDQGYVIRLFNPTDAARRIELSLAAVGIEQAVHFTKYEIKTLLLRDGSKELKDVHLLEN